MAAVVAQDVNRSESTTALDLDVLVQDPSNACAYLLPPGELQQFEVGPKTWSRVTPATVTFVIPNGSLVDEVPPFVQAPDGRPSVLIQYPSGQRAYFLDFDQLQRYRIEQPNEKSGYGISFVIPRGTELVEELPGLMVAILQIGEKPVE